MKVVRTLSIRRLLVGQFALVLVLAIALVVVMMVAWRLPLAREQQRHEQQRMAAVVAQQVQGRLDVTELLTAMLRGAHPAGPIEGGLVHPQVRRFAQQLADQAITFQAIYWVGPDGLVIDFVLPFSLDEPAVMARVGADLSNLPVLRLAAQGQHPVWSDQYLSPLMGLPVVALALPLPNGFMIAEVSVQELVAATADWGAHGDLLVLLTDGTGELLGSPDPLDPLHRRNIANLAPIAHALGGTQAHGRIDHLGETFEGYALRIDRLGWVAFTGQPLLLARTGERAAIVVTGLTVLFAIGFGLLLNLLVSTLIGRHLKRSVAYSDAVARGDYDAAPPHSRITEVQRLEHSLSRMAQEIRRREQQLRAIIDLGPTVAVQIYDRHSRVLDWNPATERILGYSREQALGKRPCDLYYDAQQQADFEAILARIAETGVPFGPFEGALRGADGNLRWIYSTTFSIPGPQEGELQFVCMDIDISEIKRLEAELRSLNSELEDRVQQRTQSLEQANNELQRTLNELRSTQDRLVQADKLAALGSLVAGVAHELNTPIGNALMATSTLQESLRQFRERLQQGLRRSELDAFVQQVGTADDIATRNLERAAELISSFKQVAVDQTSSQRRRFELAEVVHEILLTLQPVLKRSPFAVEVQVPSGIWLDSYPGPLGQVLANLIQNALLHGLQGRPSGCVRIDAAVEGEHLRLSVSDDGKGISQHLQDRVFEPFFTTRLGQGGSGLGLHIVHNLVTGVLGGRIALQSNPGHGARFTIQCPLLAPREAAPVSDNPEPAA
ncbi:signal transduction histidine kinase [Serpentinimonas raichei]|uniref:histidine kinase n=1 Tax=Serpentinimonas raichei TaxID=1458425 RepID=A0A060NPT9_9BURK|nr:ATP-binding protein [Serpentinimonas raichei]BAO80919.1 signal transduction histidine kinase [Serpentinimonas raichei]